MRIVDGLERNRPCDHYYSVERTQTANPPVLIKSSLFLSFLSVLLDQLLSCVGEHKRRHEHTRVPRTRMFACEFLWEYIHVSLYIVRPYSNIRSRIIIEESLWLISRQVSK